MRTFLRSISMLVVHCVIVASQLNAQELAFRGVEIGSNGLKGMTITRVGSEWRSKEFVSQDYGLAAEFSSDVIEKVADAAVQILKQTNVPGNKQSDIPLNRQFVVVSSGVVETANEKGKEQELEHLCELIEKQSGVRPTLISVRMEIKHAFDELTRADGVKDPTKVLVIDIGGGNTKFGTYEGTNFVSGSIRFGTTDISRFVGIASGIATEKEIESLADDVAKMLRSERMGTGLDKFQPTTVYLLGGAFFSLMGHCQAGDLVGTEKGKPDPVFAVLHRTSLPTFDGWVVQRRNDLLPDFSQLDGDHKARAEKRSELSRRVISLEKRCVAAGLIRGVFSAFELDAANKDAELKFPVSGQYAWLAGYAQNKATQDPVIASQLIEDQVRNELQNSEKRHRGLQDELAEVTKQLKELTAIVLKLAMPGAKEIAEAVKAAVPTAETIASKVKVPTAEEVAEKVKPVDADKLATELAPKLKFPTAEDLAKAVKPVDAEELAKALVPELSKQLLTKLDIPTAEAIAKQIGELKADGLADAVLDKLKEKLAKEIAAEVKADLKFPTAEDIAKAVKTPKAKQIAKALKNELVIPTAGDIATAVKKELGNLKYPTAEEIALAVTKELKIPSAVEIAKEVAARSASAKEIANEVKIPSADEIAGKVKSPAPKEIADLVRMPSPEDIAKNVVVKAPTAAEIAGLIKFPTAKEIADQITLVNHQSTPSEPVWMTVYDSCGCAYLVPRTICQLRGATAARPSPDVNSSSKFEELKVEIARSESRLENLIRENMVALPQPDSEEESSTEEDVAPRERNPKLALQAFQQGRADYDSQQTRVAWESFREATRSDAKEPLYWYFRALAEVRLGKKNEAQASAQHVAELLRGGASYTDLCHRLERVQGSERQLVQRYVTSGSITLQRSSHQNMLTE